MQKLSLPCVLAAAFIAGCAAGPQASTEPVAERVEPVTGSNIPRKHTQGEDKVQRVSPEEFARARDQMASPMPAGMR
jgi:hypothetical protein